MAHQSDSPINENDLMLELAPTLPFSPKTAGRSCIRFRHGIVGLDLPERETLIFEFPNQFTSIDVEETSGLLYLTFLSPQGRAVASIQAHEWVPPAELRAFQDRLAEGKRGRLSLPWPFSSLAETVGFPVSAHVRSSSQAPQPLHKIQYISPVDKLWYAAFVFGPAISLLTVMAIGGLGKALGNQTLLDLAGLVALAFLAPVIGTRLKSFLPLRTTEQKKSSNHSEKRILRPDPAKPLPRRFIRAATVQRDERGVILRTVDHKHLRFADPGPSAISRYVIRTSSGVPLALDLMAGDRVLVRLPWEEWFPDTSPDRVERTLGVTTEYLPLNQHGLKEPSFTHADHEYSVGPDSRMTVLSLLTCVISFSTAQGLSPVLANVVVVVSLVAASHAVVHDLAWSLILRRWSRVP